MECFIHFFSTDQQGVTFLVTKISQIVRKPLTKLPFLFLLIPQKAFS